MSEPDTNELPHADGTFWPPEARNYADLSRTEELFLSVFVPRSPYAAHLQNVYQLFAVYFHPREGTGEGSLNFVPSSDMPILFKLRRLLVAFGYPTIQRYADSLRSITCECLLFFGQVIIPYASELDAPYASFGGMARSFFYIFQSFSIIHWGNDILDYPGRIYERSTKGLLREGQVRIIEAVLKGFMDQVRGLIRRRVDICEICAVCEDTDSAMHCFFTSERFRSERLEVLLQKYLDDETVNLDVGRGIEKKTREYRQLVATYQAALMADKIGNATTEGDTEVGASRESPMSDWNEAKELAFRRSGLARLASTDIRRSEAFKIINYPDSISSYLGV